MKTHLKITVDALVESTTVQAECGFFVPNAYFPMIWEPGQYPESLSTILFCDKCFTAVQAHKSEHRYMIYGLLERREAKQEDGTA